MQWLRHLGTRLWKFASSLQLTIVCLGLLMALVLLCTLAQVNMGTFGAVEVYMRSFWVWWGPRGSAYLFPVFPGGGLVGLVLLINLVAVLVQRMKFTWKKAGLWIIHGGLILLVLGEFVSAAYQIDTRMAIEEGQTVNFVEHFREVELVVTDVTDPAHDEVYAIPQSLLVAGKPLALPGTPLTLAPRGFWPHADLFQRQATDPPTRVNAGVGVNVRLVPLAPSTRDDEPNRAAACVEPLAEGRSLGLWLTSLVLEEAQSFQFGGRTYTLGLRPRRLVLPYALTLKKFNHDLYPGTQIPKNFSSQVHLVHPGKGERRDVLISMNQPLRYEGMTFYQASFGKDDTLSILQVVRNPGWLMPYISCVLVSLGLLVHFLMMLFRSGPTGRPGFARTPRGAPDGEPGSHDHADPSPQPNPNPRTTP